MIYTYGASQKLTPATTLTQASISAPQIFTSYDQLKEYLNQSSSSNFNPTSGLLFTANSAAPTPSAATGQTSTSDYSTTNVQVAGVDEADIVKTDGQYLYVIGNNSQAVYILNADSQNPQDASVVSDISFGNSYLSGLYLSADGTELVVLGSNYISYDVYGLSQGLYPAPIAFAGWNSNTNFVYVYDVSNHADPVLERNFTMTGNYVDSRMIGDYVYDIISENAYLLNGTVLLPTIFSGQLTQNIEPTSIYYYNTSDSGYMYTTIVALNVENSVEPATETTILGGNAGSIYVSQDNIYITDQASNYRNGIINPGGPMIIATPDFASQETYTSIYRIQISGPSLTFAAEGNVTGTVMNQYSMDEYNGYFRIATTSYDYNQTSGAQIQQNNVFVLNCSNMQVVGKLENLASGEDLDSARFMGDRCYLVTFNQIDPLFVVDLSQPTNPQVLGNLTIPGFSDFLEPYDATHLIGIGQDVNTSIGAGQAEIPGDVYYTAVLGLKVSLFDVSDVSNPKEISSIVIGASGTTSEALTDPKAILFDASLNLLVLPVELYVPSNATSVTPIVYGGGTSTPASEPMIPVSSSTQFVWQGAYVFNVSLTNGITITGNVTQLDNASAYLANPSLTLTNSYPWNESQYFITRSLYIGNVLYTVSQNRVQLNSLSNLALEAQIDLD